MREWGWVRGWGWVRVGVNEGVGLVEVGVGEGVGVRQGLGLGLSRLKNLSQEQAAGNEGTRLVNILCLT